MDFQTQLMQQEFAPAAPPGGAGFVKWNPDDKAALAVLSNDDLTLYGENNGTYQGARGVTSHDAGAGGKKYFEMKRNGATSWGFMIGFGRDLEVLTGLPVGRLSVTVFPLGSNTYVRWDSQYYYSEATSLPGGATVGCAIDFTNGDVYFAINGVYIKSGQPVVTHSQLQQSNWYPIGFHRYDYLNMVLKENALYQFGPDGTYDYWSD